MAKKILFDLAGARRIVGALAGVSEDSGRKWQIGMGMIGGKSPHAIVGGTDGCTTAIWCEETSALDGGSASFYPVEPDLLTSAMLGNEAFINAKTGTLELSTDATLAAKVGSAVSCQLTQHPPIDIFVPSNSAPNKLLCSATVDPEDVPAFLAGLGVLFGFGDRPGIAIRETKIDGYATGKTAGAFSVSSTLDAADNAEMFYTVDRGLCMSLISLGLATGMNDRKYSMSVAVIDSSPSGGSAVVKIQCGPICVWAPTVVCPPPDWVDYLPAAVVEQVRIDWPSMVVMLSSFASACFVSQSAGDITLSYKTNRGLMGSIDIPSAGGTSKFVVETAKCTLPEFTVSLSRNQVLAMSYAVSSGDEAACVNLSLGDGGELMLGGEIGRGWTIRLL